jgi:hypothetical protein
MSQIVNPQGYGLDDLEIRVRFSAAGEPPFFSKASKPIAGHTQSHMQCVSRTIFSGVMQTGREAGRSPPSSNESVNTWSHRPSPTYRYFVLSRLTKHRNNLSLLLVISLAELPAALHTLS